MKRLFQTLFFVCVAICSFAANEVTWTFKLEGENTDSPRLVMKATIAPGFHLYAPENPAGGSQPLEFYISPKGCKLDGKPVANKKYTKEYDDVFMVDQYFFSNSVTFTQKLKPTAEKFSVEAEVKGQTCNDGGCYPVYASKTLSGTAKVDPAAKEEVEDPTEAVAAPTDSLQAAVDSLKPEAALAGSADDKSWWNNVEAEMKALEENPSGQNHSIWYIFIAGFIGGLIALMTPCVWPMIPMTVSFFLKQNKDRSKAIRSGIIYGLSIIVIYLALGIAVTAIFGASALNELATSALFNIIFFLLLVLFAFSFMGGFELTLPSKWTNKIDSKVDSTSGYLSIFFMAFTLVLVSFSCTGPIIGTLLVEAASQGSYVGPAVGMGAFALALAIPFTLCAIFPSLLKELPRSGGWLNSVKVILGFLELALSLKFLSVADLAYGWGILDREVFISLWVAIFVLLSLYLLGKFRFSHDSPTEHVGILRFFLSLFSFSFAIYLVPGLWGAPLKGVSAFVPPLFTQDFNLYGSEGFKSFDDYDEGMKYAADNKLPVLIDFSGYGCVNCRKMEGAVFDTEEVSGLIKDKFVLITLMVDDKHQLPASIDVVENGKNIRLETVGEKWSYLQRSKFNASTQPYYVVLDGNGQPLVSSYSYDENVARFVEWLQTALTNFKVQ